MSKKVRVEPYQPDPLGPAFGLIADPAHIRNSQAYAHEHTEAVTRDYLSKGEAGPRVAGFERTIGAGLALSIAAGEAVSPAGLLYDTVPAGQAQAATFGAAHASLARLDLVFATLETDAPALTEFRPFRQLRTPAELAAGVPPYAPQNVNQATELHNRATVNVRAGVPAANPVAPAAGANEVALYHVRVPAGATSLAAGDITDVRPLIRSLSEAFALIDAVNTNLSETIDDRAAALIQVPANTGLSKVYDDAANSLTLAGVAATAAAQGMMPAADKAAMSARTAAAVASTIVQRDANADAAVRDLTLARRINFADGSLLDKPVRAEQQILLFEVETPFSTTTGPYPGTVQTVGRAAGIPFYLNVRAEDFVNVPLVFECVVEHMTAGSTTVEAQLYNVTDAVVLAVCRSQHGAGAVQTRSDSFQITGTGRKRLQVRLGVQVAGETGRIFSARLVAYPSYSACGGWGQSLCPV